MRTTLQLAGTRAYLGKIFEVKGLGKWAKAKHIDL